VLYLQVAVVDCKRAAIAARPRASPRIRSAPRSPLRLGSLAQPRRAPQPGAPTDAVEQLSLECDPSDVVVDPHGRACLFFADDFLVRAIRGSGTTREATALARSICALSSARSVARSWRRPGIMSLTSRWTNGLHECVPLLFSCCVSGLCARTGEALPCSDSVEAASTRRRSAQAEARLGVLPSRTSQLGVSRAAAQSSASACADHVHANRPTRSSGCDPGCVLALFAASCEPRLTSPSSRHARSSSSRAGRPCAFQLSCILITSRPLVSTSVTRPCLIAQARGLDCMGETTARRCKVRARSLPDEALLVRR